MDVKECGGIGVLLVSSVLRYVGSWYRYESSCIPVLLGSQCHRKISKAKNTNSGKEIDGLVDRLISFFVLLRLGTWN